MIHHRVQGIGPRAFGCAEILWNVSAGLFRNQANADTMAAQLRNMGFTVAIEMFNDLYAVKVGEYDDLEDATELEQKLRRMGYDTLIVSRQTKKAS